MRPKIRPIRTYFGSVFKIIFLLLSSLFVNTFSSGQSHFYIEADGGGALPFGSGNKSRFALFGVAGKVGLGSRFLVTKRGYSTEIYYGVGAHYQALSFETNTKQISQKLGLSSSSQRAANSSNFLVENEVILWNHKHEAGLGLSLLTGFSRESRIELELDKNDSTKVYVVTPFQKGVLIGLGTSYKWMFDHGGTVFWLTGYDQILNGRHYLSFGFGIGLNIMFYYKPQRMIF